MALVDLTSDVTTIARTGIAVATQVTTATDSYYQFPSHDGRVWVELQNLDSHDHVASFVTPALADGLDVADVAVTVPAGSIRLCGPFGPVFGSTVQMLADWSTGGLVGIRVYYMPIAAA